MDEEKEAEMSSSLQNDHQFPDSDESAAEPTPELNPGDVKVQDPMTTPAPKTSIRVDLGHFRDDLVHMFRDRNVKTTTLNLLKDDLNSLKDDLNSLKDDLNSFFQKKQPKQKVKEDSPTFRTTTLDQNLDQDLKSLFIDQTLLKGFQRDQSKKVSTKSAEELDQQVGDQGSQQNQETVGFDEDHGKVAENTKTGMRTHICETQDFEETILLSQEAQRCEQITEDSVNISSFPLIALESTAVKLFSLRQTEKHKNRNQPQGDEWSIKNFAGYLTLDPNTANPELHLTDCHRTATRIWSDHQPSDHPDRFECCPQLLCREGLLDTFYWEVTWSGGADIGVTYNSISRVGDAMSCLLGHNQCSWSLECSEGSYTPCHNNRRFKSCCPQPFTHRIGVYLDWAAGSLSFYSVSQNDMVHIHTFHSTFTEPLYPGFWVWAYDGSVSLCQVELDWERLLQ